MNSSTSESAGTSLRATARTARAMQGNFSGDAKSASCAVACTAFVAQRFRWPLALLYSAGRRQAHLSGGDLGFSMSPAGLRFSSGSAAWLSQHGISRVRLSNPMSDLITAWRSAHGSARPHLIHRLARGILPRPGGTRTAFVRRCVLVSRSSRERRVLPCPTEFGAIVHIRRMITARRRASATIA